MTVFYSGSMKTLKASKSWEAYYKKIFWEVTKIINIEKEMNMGLINKGWYGMFFTCGIWCVAAALSISPLSEQTYFIYCIWMLCFLYYLHDLLLQV